MYNVMKIEILLPQSINPKSFGETIASVPAHEIRHKYIIMVPKCIHMYMGMLKATT